MRTSLGLVLLAAASWAFLLQVNALATTGAPPHPLPGDPFTVPLPWYVHSAWAAAVAATAWMALRLLDRGILGRLVRGRGLTPAAR